MKRWKGHTWYDDLIPESEEDGLAIAATREGFLTAMNSPVVRGLYEALRQVRLVDLMGTPGAQEALKAYEAGLKEDDLV